MKQVTSITFDPMTKVIMLELEDGSVYEGKNYSDSTSSMTFTWNEVEQIGRAHV